jgi:hypothetical protein
LRRIDGRETPRQSFGDLPQSRAGFRTALTFKRAAAVAFQEMIAVVVGVLPELGPEGAGRFIANASLLAGAIWSHSHPVPAILAAYDTDPSLAVLRMEFEPALSDGLRTLLYGALPRQGR